MTRYTFPQIEQNIAKITGRQNYDGDFLFELLAAYGRSSSSITQLRNGVTNKSKVDGEVLQKDVVFWKVFEKGTQLEPEVFNMKDNELVEKFHPRFLVATDLVSIAAYDTKDQDTLTTSIQELSRHTPFFMAWSGKEKNEDDGKESEVDRNAAERMKDFYDAIEKENFNAIKNDDGSFLHGLNVFFSRLLFCLFAEDTGLFNQRQFSEAVDVFAESDGSNMKEFFEILFDALNTKDEDKERFNEPFRSFPYVNGSIFDTVGNHIVIPEFGPEAYHILLYELVKYDWSNINPDIFGTMFQGIVDPKSRDEGGMDYTSVANIEKVIYPLFMDELNEEFEKSFEDDGRVRDKNGKRIENLEKLWARISKIKVFDPACGSGNFLIISYKRLRELELRILNEMVELRGGGFLGKFKSRIKIDNFYGIELEDFPRELAVLSMYIAEHQMDMQFNEEFGKKIDMLPITDMPNIVHDNSARIDWQTVCPNRGHNVIKATYHAENLFSESFGGNNPISTDVSYEYDEIYVIGNPPYKGADEQSPSQKSDFKYYFDGEDYSGNMDYIGIWFIKGARYIAGTKAKLAFVSTNSVCQGEHVGIMFPKIFDEDVEIGFARQSFKWSNNAKDNSQVMVIVLGLQPHDSGSKRLYVDDYYEEVPHINPYLIPGDDVIIYKQKNILSYDFPPMVFGSMPRTKDLVVTAEERQKILQESPEADKFIKLYLGAEEYIHNKKRYCLWIEDGDVEEAKAIPEINQRLVKVSTERAKSKAASTRKFADLPHRFVQISYKPTPAIIVPSASSENRTYIPMGFLEPDTIISNAANAVYDAELWLFAILESKMHMAWIRTVCGKLKTDYRYASTLGYNTFPCPPLTPLQKNRLSESAENILMARESHSEKTLAQLYKPETMPVDLREAHDMNDILVDKLYRSIPFPNDEERLKALFDLYEKMTGR